MSLQEPARRTATDVVGLDSGIDALRESPEFTGPVEHLAPGHTCNDHLALFYETPEEQLETFVPFIRQGLERDEAVVCVIDRLDRQTMTRALERGGVDVDAAVAAGALVFETVGDTYLRNGTFDPDEMVEFYDATIREATDEFSALRVAAETTWLQGESATMQEFLAYESKINRLFEGEDCIALCSYDRNGFEPAVVRDLIRTHPHLIYDGTVCHNFYYTPPSEFFGPDEPGRDVKRMMGMLVERTEAKAALQGRKQFLQDFTEIIASPQDSFETKLQAVFELGCDWFGLDLGTLNRVDPEDDWLIVDEVSGDHDHFQPGAELPLSETYCQAATDIKAAASVSDPAADGFDGLSVYEDYGVEGYLGTYVPVDGGADRTLGFVADGSRPDPAIEDEHTLLDLMGQWVKYELERQHRERYLRESYRITSDPERSFDEKVESLLELGCDRFGLDLGYFARTDEDADHFEVVRAVGEDDQIRSGDVGPLSTSYCEKVLAADGPVRVHDAAADGWGDDPAYQTYGLDAYLGTSLSVGNDDYGTLCFAAQSAREEPFGDEAVTFLELMSQWIEYELERQHREQSLRDLYEITADREPDFEEQMRRVLAFGCERFGFDRGYLVDVHCDETVEIEQAVGTGDADVHTGIPEEPLEPGQFCRRAVDVTEPLGVPDVGERGWDSDPVYGESALQSYFGVSVTDGVGTYGTLAFCGTEPRERPFTDAEETFLELMGQWVSHELMQRRHRRQLAALNDMGRDLMCAEDGAEIDERTVEHAGGSLKVPLTAILRYDGDRGALTATAQTPRAEDELPTAALCDREGGSFWDAFVAKESRVVEDVSEVSGAGDDVTAALAVPLGTRGLFVAATTAPDGLSGADRDFLATTAATVEAADARADREQQLRRREETLESQNETLERLNRVNDIIRNIDQALVGADSRAEIESVVCEHLAGVGPYELAWIGEPDPVGDGVAPKEWAGAEKGYIADLRGDGEDGIPGHGPAGRTIATREPQVVNDVLDDEAIAPWRQAALNRGYHACIALPMVYEQSLYGTLVVYAGRPGVFEDLERSVLTELTDTIAYAINAAESKKAIVSDEVTHLTFDVADPSLEIVALCREIGCSFTLESLVPEANGGLKVFFTTHGAPPSAVLDFGDRLAVQDLSLVDERSDQDLGLFEATLDDESLCRTVVDHGGRPREVTIEDGEASVVVELAADAAIREFVEMFQTTYPAAELVAQRTHERPKQPPTECSAGLTDALTDRQLEALQTAYVSGYLEEPRVRSATDIADSMDIAQPTFNSHLRAAQRKVCERLFDELVPPA